MISGIGIEMMTNNPWGNECFICGQAPKIGQDVYGLLGPLTCVKEQKMICKTCVELMKKYSRKK